MIGLLRQDRLVMGTAIRVTDAARAYRRGHRTGNSVLTGLVAARFGARVTDMLSGYRVFSRRFVKSFPALAGGFETETELTVHARRVHLKTSRRLRKKLTNMAHTPPAAIGTTG